MDGRYESFVLAPGENKVEVEIDTREFDTKDSVPDCLNTNLICY